jgi:hypothetical protein
MPVIYDKAKFHAATVAAAGLGPEQAYVHTAMFLGWLIDHDLVSRELLDTAAQPVAQFKRREITPVQVYEWWDGCLLDEMLDDEGNAFASAYFDFDKGQYLDDYRELLVRELPSEFHVPFTWENYRTIAKRIDERYDRWRRRKSGRWRLLGRR